MDKSEIVQGLVGARKQVTHYAPPTAAIPALDEEGAYGLQRQFVDLWCSTDTGDSVAGFKGAATAAPLQKALSLSGPVTGVLFGSGARDAGEAILAADFRGLLLEAELGFRVARDISSPIEESDIGGVVDAVMPMVELADPGFGSNRFSGLDLIASNSASAGYIIGTPIAVQADELDAVEVAIARDKEVLGAGTAASVLGSQWIAVHWLINEVVRQGYTVKRGHILLTGAIGGAFPGKPGRYLADYGAAGRIEFVVR